MDVQEMVKAARKQATLRDAVKLMKTAKVCKLTPGKLTGPPHEPASKAKPGAGGRFEALKGKISRKGDVRDPGAVAAAIGRAKFGKGKFQAMAAARAVPARGGAAENGRGHGSGKRRSGERLAASGP